MILTQSEHVLEFDDGRGWMVSIAGMHKESAELARAGRIPESLELARQEHLKNYGDDPRYAARFRVLSRTTTHLTEGEIEPR